MATVNIPSVMRSLAGGSAQVTVAGATVREVLTALVAQHPALGPRLFDEQGGLRRYVNVFLNEEDIRYLRSLDTPVDGADRLSLLPAMAGG